MVIPHGHAGGPVASAHWLAFPGLPRRQGKMLRGSPRATERGGPALPGPAAGLSRVTTEVYE